MNKDNKKYESGTQATELSEKSLDEVAGGGGSVGAMEEEATRKAHAAPPKEQAAQNTMKKAVR